MADVVLAGLCLVGMLISLKVYGIGRFARDLWREIDKL